MNWRTLLILVLTLSWGGCATLYREVMMINTPSDLSTRLLELGYLELFLRYDDQALNSVWTQPGAPTALANLVTDSSAPMQARFLAAEILFSKDSTYPPESAKAALAQVYAAALVENYTGMANVWGLPGHLSSVGQHAAALGDAAVAAFVPLLENDTPLFYSGSQEAMVGNSYGYRVKDMAAFIISQIKNIPYTVYKTAAERDPEIARLKAQLP
jgi:hypothetical protein